MWKEFIENEQAKDYYKKLDSILLHEYQNYTIYPEKSKIFNAFNLTDIDSIKVVIIGQDPYYNEGQANGLAFSVNQGIKIPPTLRNIFKELNNKSDNGDLTYLAKQGVMLLNNTLTVRSGEPNSHSKIGWNIFTDNTIKFISDRKENIVFMLWGNLAKSKKNLIDLNKHLVLEAIHPSPSVNGFLGCNHFNKCNEFLTSKGIELINW